MAREDGFGRFIVAISGETVVTRISGETVVTAISGQLVAISGQVVAKISGETVVAKVSGETVVAKVSGQLVSISGAIYAQVSGQVISKISGETVVTQISGQLVSISGQVVAIVSGQPILISGQVVKPILPTQVRAGYTLITSLSGGTELSSGEVRLLNIRNLPGNENMWMGRPGVLSGTGWLLQGGEDKRLEIANLNALYIYAQSSGQYVSYIGEAE